jgi:nucleotide-binding universal stress UspA family protein
MHILIATDGSPHARQALEFASLLAAKANAQLTVLGVTEQPGGTQATQLGLEDARRLLSERGVECVLKRRDGHAAEEILRETEENQYDLLVMGARGRSRLTRFLMGSVSYRVLEHAQLPVLIVREARPQIERILVTVGGRPQSTPTICFGTELARKLGARATLLHVTNPIPQMYMGLDEMEETLPELLQTDTEEGRTLRRGVRLMQERDIDGDIELRHGLVEQEIILEAREQDVDLIVLGSSVQAGPLGRLLVGNITRRVIDGTKRPVLVVPGEKQREARH